MQLYGQCDRLFRLKWTTRDRAINHARHYHAIGLRRLSVATNGDVKPPLIHDCAQRTLSQRRSHGSRG
ncbi:hypothetical protein ACCAA_270038 [Candidatus Accumulibacter aalborgensis]|uniref:Uncharacterized protein n=1 Tax=Candidatus Accumulibacter aalborgensis TaxID=1860102 RepID=A0A1A8XP92_9PROT|nr:hypothetical protein ACCAA_270038 [Candidatus Accumulibacter aalborgensis]